MLQLSLPPSNNIDIQSPEFFHEITEEIKELQEILKEEGKLPIEQTVFPQWGV